MNSGDARGRTGQGIVDDVVLTTPRLLLRQLRTGDAQFILRLLNEPAFLRFVGDRGVRSVADATGYIASGPQESYRRHGFGLYLATDRDTTLPLGVCGIMCKPWLPAPDLAYAFVPEAGGRGIATEAAGAVLRFGFDTLGLARVVAVVLPENAASVRILEKLGFAPAGVVQDPVAGSELLMFAASR